jgi:hypothetical protein
MRTPRQLAMRRAPTRLFFLLVLNGQVQSWERGVPFRLGLQSSQLAELKMCQSSLSGCKNLAEQFTLIQSPRWESQ